MSTELSEYLFVIGQRLRSERERLGFTQAELGKKIDATSRTVGKYETGETEARVSQLLELKKLGADINYILFGSVSQYVVSEPGAIYERGDVDLLVDAYAHADELGRSALMAVVALISKE